MSDSVIQLEDVIIPSGTNVSNIIHHNTFDDAIALRMYSPAGLDAHTFTIEVCNDQDAVAGSTWFTDQVSVPATDSSPPAAGKSRTYFELTSAKAWRIKDTGGNVAADRTIKLDKIARI